MHDRTDLLAIGRNIAAALDGHRARRDGHDNWIGPEVGAALGFCDLTNHELVEALRVFWTREGVLSAFIDERGILRVHDVRRCPSCGGPCVIA